MRAQHATRAGYRAGCRCERCVEANREFERQWQATRRARFAAGELDVAHGTRSGYNVGCRCDLCRAKQVAAVRDWKRGAAS